jgi:hypothetical protein
MNNQNIKLDSIEMLTQTTVGNLVLNTAVETISQTNDLCKTWNATTEIFNKTGFTFPFCFLFVTCDIPKFLR